MQAIDFVNNALKAMEEDRLQLQHTDKSSSEACMYRTTTGCVCAVGASIPEEDYDDIIEGNDVEGAISHLKCKINPKNNWFQSFKKNVVILDDMQTVHDQFVFQVVRGDLRKEVAVTKFKKYLENLRDDIERGAYPGLEKAS